YPRIKNPPLHVHEPEIVIALVPGESLRCKTRERSRRRLPPHRVPPLPERIVASPLHHGAALVRERVAGAEVIHVHIPRPRLGTPARDDRHHSLRRVDVVSMRRGRTHRGHPLVEVPEIDRLLLRRGLADPLLVAVIRERDRARALLDRPWQIERR